MVYTRLVSSDGLYKLKLVEYKQPDPTEFLNLGSESFGDFCGQKSRGTR
jgi:hypothetical protein